MRRAVNLSTTSSWRLRRESGQAPFFTLGEGASKWRKEVLAPYPNAEVCSFDGLLMDFLPDRGARSSCAACARRRISSMNSRWLG